MITTIAGENREIVTIPKCEYDRLKQIEAAYNKQRENMRCMPIINNQFY